MTRDHDQDLAASGNAEIVEELRSLVRPQVTSSEELRQLRDRAATERIETQQRVMEAIAEKAGVDLRSILEDARGGRRRRDDEIGAILPRLDAEANRRANQEKARLHRIREQYRDAFQGQVAGLLGSTQLKFRDVVHTYEEPIAPVCAHLDSSIWNPTIGPDIAVTTEILPSTDTPGTWLHPRIDIVARSCDDMDVATTFQELLYRLDAPATSFGVENVRADVIANGIFRSVLGDPQGWFIEADPLYYHTHVELSVAMTQQVGGELHTWPLLTEELFPLGATSIRRRCEPRCRARRTRTTSSCVAPTLAAARSTAWSTSVARRWPSGVAQGCCSTSDPTRVMASSSAEWRCSARPSSGENREWPGPRRRGSDAPFRAGR